MKEKIYRTVSVNDRLPKDNLLESYFTDEGYLSLIDGEWKEWWQADQYIIKHPTWWLEECELPTEDSLQEIYSINRDLYGPAFAAGMQKGVSFIFNHIQGDD